MCMYVHVCTVGVLGLSVLLSTQITCRGGSCISQCNTVALRPYFQHSPRATNVCYTFVIIVTTCSTYSCWNTSTTRLLCWPCCQNTLPILTYMHTVSPATCSASILEQHDCCSILLPFRSSSSSSGSPTGCPPHCTSVVQQHNF